MLFMSYSDPSIWISGNRVSSDQAMLSQSSVIQFRWACPNCYPENCYTLDIFSFSRPFSVNPRNGYTHLAPTTMPCSKQLCNHTENNNYDRFVGPLLSKLAAIVHYTNLCILLCYTCPNVQEACLLYVNHVRVFSDLLLWIEIIFELVLDGEFSSLGDQGLLIHINTSEQTKIHGLKTSRFKWVKYVTCNRKCGDMILLAQADSIK